MMPWRGLKRKRIIILLVFIFCLMIFTLFFSHRLVDKLEENKTQIRNPRKQLEYVDKRGIHVIVGHYVGNDLPWNPSPNLTDEILNSNGYSPLPKAGENGDAYIVPGYDLQRSKSLFHINKFNILASDRIPVNRTLLDGRRLVCKEKFYDVKNLPTTSVIIVYHNEAWSTLLRTVHSVINRSPAFLLKEIILVDDSSTRTFLKEPLDEYVSQLPVSVRVIRIPERIGLIRSRSIGARSAIGDVLTFLDAHCECSIGWLEPLLSRIAQSRKSIVCPVIDIIHDETFQYIRSFELHWGAFNWELHFRWYPVSQSELVKRINDSTSPFKTPVMAGGLFSIDRSYFEEIGGYDDKMDIWGGENIEMSFRVWQCGGSVEISPCSHVGHVFRKSSPYSFPRAGGVGNVLYQNLGRAAATWMDEWKDFFFKLNPYAAKINANIDVTARLKLRNKMKCRSFKWYLDNVWPEHFLPTDSRFFGKVRNIYNDKCMQIKSTTQNVGKIIMKACVIELYQKQLFIYSEKLQLMSDESVCLDSPEGSADTYVVMMACSGLLCQTWQYHKSKQSFMHVKSSLCLDLPSKAMPEALTLQKCDGRSSQRWMMEHSQWK